MCFACLCLTLKKNEDKGPLLCEWKSVLHSRLKCVSQSTSCYQNCNQVPSAAMKPFFLGFSQRKKGSHLSHWLNTGVFYCLLWRSEDPTWMILIKRFPTQQLDLLIMKAKGKAGDWGFWPSARGSCGPWSARGSSLQGEAICQVCCSKLVLIKHAVVI